MNSMAARRIWAQEGSERSKQWHLKSDMSHEENDIFDPHRESLIEQTPTGQQFEWTT